MNMIQKSLKNGLALRFHENSKVTKSFSDYEKEIQFKIYPSSKSIKIEKVLDKDFEKNESEFINVLINRKSIRKFAHTGVSLNQLSKLLSLSFGFNHRKENDIQFRTYASAGARYPIEVYPVVLKSDDMELGIYHYNVIENSIELIRPGDYKETIKTFYSNHVMIDEAPCYILFSMIFERTMNKYGERGYRFIYLDAGHMSQNLYLVSEFLGLGVVGIGGGKFDDDVIDKFIGLNQLQESFFYGFAIGNPLFSK